MNSSRITTQSTTLVPIGGELANISCAAFEELCALCNIPCPENVVENPAFCQLHNVLILIRSGILHIERNKHEDGTCVLVLKVSNEDH
jgi:hypothetical protein